MKLKLLPIVALCFAFSASAQKIDTAALDRLFDTLSIHHKSMASVLLSHNGKKLYERAIGYAVVDSTQSVKATPATRYRIGSITKTFTATMVMQLVEEKKLALDTHLDQFFPNIPNAGQITIEMMLRHRAGIHNFTNDEAFWKFQTEPRTRGQLLADFEKYKSDFAPGAEVRYSNTGYVLLGFIIEDVTKKSYEKNLQERISNRIGLTNTRFGGMMDPSKGDAYSYTYTSRWEKRDEAHWSQLLGAGATVSTPADVTAFIHALFNGRLVSPESLRRMTGIVDTFGIGLVSTPFYERKGFGHTGGIDGFHTATAYFPGDSLTATVFCNGVDYPMNDLFVALLSAYYQFPVAIPDFNAPPLTASEVEPYIGAYSNGQIPMKVTISYANNKLYFQPAEQPVYQLTRVKKDVFKLDAVRLVIEFNPKSNAFTATQDGEAYLFTK
ncbi:CubicO group peptidase, beta-lactamase class C family [Dyadobacter sp. SG02]|uniref:serine hydrolase domain-containing protein n=1 Tax=Dyadobacter sp. SG02 TaxID=1855291 RepID=UPI0008B7C904|nr:serine hydrolase domain-containing protein [Dyadobacter sp. SG02]SEJ58131.1 CubicO group peptidase, beta-lactamase class C family [Dyadobacter sp. SG02]